MNAYAQAQQAYAPTASAIRTDRGTEYQAFAQITAQLRGAAAKGKPGFQALVQALHDNRNLWTLLATQVADDANGLPQDVRARIFYLAEFTQAHTRKVLSKNATVDALVEVNTAIMRGLNQTGAAA